MVRTEKDVQRDLIRRLKKSFDATQLAFYSEQLAQSLFENYHYQTARNVALFASLPDEPDTTEILAHALNGDKKVWLPAVIDEEYMEIRRYLGVESLVEGAFHILEPMGELLADYSELDLILVPEMAFDLSCHRLGRGRGYYDCFLHRCSHKTWRIGYCFPFQMLDKVSVEPHDEQVNECISL